MEYNEQLSAFTEGDYGTKIEVLSYISDLFEAYNPEVDYILEVINMLVVSAINCQEEELRFEVLDVLTKAFVHHSINGESLTPLVQNLQRFSPECIARCIDILSFTHDGQFIPLIESYTAHPDESIHESVNFALKEIQGK